MPYGGTIELNIVSFILLYIMMLFVYVLIIRISNKRHNTRDSTRKYVIDVIFIFYLLSVLNLTLLPIDILRFDDFRIEMTYWMVGRDYFTTLEIANIQVIPFRSIIGTLLAPLHMWRFTLIGIGGNIALLFPLPIFLCLRSEKKLTLKKAILIGFCTSLLIEIAQLIINLITHWPNRLVLIDDLILNTFGLFLGYVTYSKWSSFFEKTVTKINDFFVSSL